MSLRDAVRKNKMIRDAAKSIYFYFAIIANFVRWGGRFCMSYFFEKKSCDCGSELYIYGWYGTETAGDKLILLGLLWESYKESPDRKVIILSMDPDITAGTILEIITVLKRYSNRQYFISYIESQVEVRSEEAISSVGRGNTIALGGGPIMDDPILAKWLMFSLYAKFRSANSIVLGNGIGPLKKNVSTLLASRFINTCDAVVLRNKVPSGLVVKKSYVISLDPAFICVEVLNLLGYSKLGRETLAINSRSIPYEYVQNIVVTDQQVIAQTAKYVEDVLAKFSTIQRVVPLSTHESGAIKDSFMSEEVVKLIKLNTQHIDDVSFIGGDLCSVLETAQMSRYVVTTRFHGMIISLISGCEVAALDYSDCDGKSNLFYRSISAEHPVSKAYSYKGADINDFISIEGNVILASKIQAMSALYREALV